MQHETGINLVTLKSLQLHIARGFNQFKVNTRVLLTKCPHPARQQIKTHGRYKCQAQTPGFAVCAGSSIGGQGLRQWRLRHMQAQGCTAKVQFFGHGDKLPPQAKFYRRYRVCARTTHMPYILIQPKKWIGANESKPP